jgi:hypothetical protein
MKKYKIILFITVMAGIMTSCGEDYLTLYPSGDVVAGAPATLDVIEQNVTGAYQIMYFDDYANFQWMPVYLLFDVCTDDLYKGGSDASDQEFVLRIAEFRALAATDTPNGWWQIFFAGLKRCNGALEAMDNAVDVQPDVLAKRRAEMLTLRAYYVHWLWKAYGRIPYFDKAWTEEPFIARQHSFDELYEIIIADLDAAIATTEFPMVATGANRGRITKAMAMMTKARVVMYKKDQSKYAAVLQNMKDIINDGAYRLVTTAGNVSSTAPTTNPVEWMYLREGEFCSESIFEVNCYPEARSWGNAWGGFGHYTPRFIGARDIPGDHPVFVGGWGFCAVQPATYAKLFDDPDDCRKEASVWKFDSQVNYHKTGLYLKKYIARKGYNVGTRGDRDLNYENNKRIYRLAEAYLNAAELEVATGGSQAQQYLDAIRARAFGDDSHSIPATLNNIKRERHREFFGEGHRFWDLMRWGSDEDDTPIATLLTVHDNNVPINRDWKETCRFLPIPQDEIDKTIGTEFELEQNPGY